MTVRSTLDVSHLPTYAFGQRSLMWWGTAGMIVIEGTLFAIGLVTYFYLRGLAQHWPLSAPPRFIPNSAASIGAQPVCGAVS